VELKLSKKAQKCAQSNGERDIAGKVLWSV
jgi:hypothetical protein